VIYFLLFFKLIHLFQRLPWEPANDRITVHARKQEDGHCRSPSHNITSQHQQHLQNASGSLQSAAKLVAATSVHNTESWHTHPGYINTMTIIFE